LIRVQPGESSLWPFSDRADDSRERREFDLAVREIELKRREAALERIERDLALTPVPATYFEAGHNAEEDDWWAKQLGGS
jgi:hypothetical protein